MGKSSVPRNAQLRSPLLLALTLFAAVLRGSSAAECNAGDRQALLAFKDQLLDPRNALSSWTPSSDCCKWPEIQCNLDTGRVTGLFLSNQFAASDLPSDYQLKVKQGIQGAGAPLGSLKQLTSLSMRKVAFGFAHPVPSQIGTLPKLQSLYLLQCEFSGEIPSALGSLSALSEMSIQDNRFTGGMPDSFGNLKALRTLSLVNNTLTSIGSQQITLLKKLQSVDLSNNRISGAIPKWLGGLTISGTLSLSQNPFTGPIPGELCNIVGLISLYIGNTQVTSIPPEIGNCKSLLVLSLVDSKLTGNLPAGLGKLTKLQTLGLGSSSLNNNRLTGTLPVALGDLPDLVDFDVANNKFHGPIPANYGPFAVIKVPSDKTRFYGNNLSGPIPEALSTLPASRFRPGNPGLCGAPLAACK